MTNDVTNRTTEWGGNRRLFLWLAVSMLLATGCSKVDLYSSLPEREANIMMSALLEAGIDCSKDVGNEEQTWKLLVRFDDFARSVNVLAEMGYPTDHRDRMGDVFQKSALVSSPTEDRIRYVYALSEELAETVSRIDGVVDARVHVVLPNNDPFSEQSRPSSASVYIKHRDDVDMSASCAQIKELVAKSIEGLSPQNVEVFMDEVQPIRPAAQSGASYVRVLGVTLEPGSVKRFWMLVGGLAVAGVINLGFVLWLAFSNHLPKLSWFNRSVSATPSAAAAS